MWAPAATCPLALSLSQRVKSEKRLRGLAELTDPWRRGPRIPGLCRRGSRKPGSGSGGPEFPSSALPDAPASQYLPVDLAAPGQVADNMVLTFLRNGSLNLVPVVFDQQIG